MTDDIGNAVNPPLAPKKLVIILDNEVVDILHTDERLSAILTSAPLVIDVTDLDAEVGVGWSWDPENRTLSGYGEFPGVGDGASTYNGEGSVTLP